MSVISLSMTLLYICFNLQDIVSGVVILQSKGDLTHNGVTLTMDGAVGLQLSAKSVGLFEAFYNSLKVGINAESLTSFRKLLKTHLFDIAYNN